MAPLQTSAVKCVYKIVETGVGTWSTFHEDACVLTPAVLAVRHDPIHGPAPARQAPGRVPQLRRPQSQSPSESAPSLCTQSWGMTFGLATRHKRTSSAASLALPPTSPTLARALKTPSMPSGTVPAQRRGTCQPTGPGCSDVVKERGGGLRFKVLFRVLRRASTHTKLQVRRVPTCRRVCDAFVHHVAVSLGSHHELCARRLAHGSRLRPRLPAPPAL